jgi:hypothetical protein
MKNSRTLILALLSLSVLSAPLLAGSTGPQRPVLEAARQASPTARWQAAQHFRQAYPGLPADLHSQLKAQYPTLEHAVVDAALDTWEAHPGLGAKIAQDVELKYGTEISAARQDVAKALEAAYPNFRVRLARVLEEKGMLATWQRFVAGYDPGLAEELRSILASNGAWRPGALRTALLTGQGSRPVLERLTEMGQEHGAETARQAIAVVRRRAPGLAADFTVRWLEGRQELANALRAEFPGAGKVVAQTLQAKHPQLVSQILATVEPQTREARADLRANLDARLPGFTGRCESLLMARYPNLRPEMISILKG